MSARDDVVLPPESLALDSPTAAQTHAPPGLLLGTLVGFADEGRTPLVAADDPAELSSPARPARTVVTLHGAHVGRRLVLGHEAGCVHRLIVLGVLSGEEGWPLRETFGQVEISADGECMTVTARDRMVLRCGKSSIVMRSDGRIEIRGETVITQATGANHVRGGSVQLN
jgi:hypothetical protein